MFSKILIANRGEIALRIIRACKEMGIKTVAVYSQADENSLPVRLADEAVCIGPANSTHSYLNIPAIISAAEITDVEAIHPGYGFLAENAHFAEICQSCQIAFIGPSPYNIRLMGDKMAARETMKNAKIPIIPGTLSAVQSKEEALKIAKRLKYPVMIKAAAGGGGRGMRVCHNDVRLISALITAQNEAEATFGNPEVYLEKYMPNSRHIEFQVVADKYGHVVHLGERDCSLQRRHQKLLEESPSLALDEKLRRKMGEIAVRATKIVKYQGVGTIEFLLDEDANFYFLEMNTRIQVEHPVTEMITGIDLVKTQLHLAAGEKLRIKQDKIKFSGHALECRINAEDPEHGFLPSPGIIKSLSLPGGPNIRIDTHIYAGYEIPTFYDSLIAKIIARGNNRHEALATMRRALDEFFIEPIKTTIPFHRQLLDNRNFLKGEISTHFIEDLLAEKEKE